MASAAMLSLHACELPAEETEDGPGMLPPPQLCSQSRDALAQLEKRAALMRKGPDEVAIAQEIWLQMPEPNRAAIAQAIAIDAVCTSKQPAREREVVIRSETGGVLTRRIIETSFEMAKE